MVLTSFIKAASTMISIARVKDLAGLATKDLAGRATGQLDLNVLQELRVESSREGFRFIERLCDEWASGANRFNDSGEALFLAVVDGQVVGVCGLNRDPYASAPNIGRVRRLYVLREHRRSGVGRALLNAVITYARNHFKILRVRTDAATQFFVANGFRLDASDPEATHVLDLTKAPSG
jgi:GNAT superfamily N-acetyltransferase